MIQHQKVLLSDADIKDIMLGRPPPIDSPPIERSQIRLMTYDELAKMRSMEEVFNMGRTPIVMLLYVHSSSNHETVGHWSLLLWRQGGVEVEFFDSYGQKPDDMLFNIERSVRAKLSQDESHLCCLLADYLARYPSRIVVSSSKPLQRDKEGINTCGRYVGYRARHWGLSLIQFEKLLERCRRVLGSNATYDDVIVELTEQFIKDQ